uniref:Reverse transcriptase/retrotransposon-derived protein RNase H-like domain-containing protein n=1 Tax=Romanomermis culicivorax TaxID=13658 RepID=A0A915IEG9_ROMCU
MLSSGLVKRTFNKQSLQLPICRKIKVANDAFVNTQGPVVVSMESTFGEHMIKCVILNDDNNDQCIIGMDFLAHPVIHAILNFKDNYIKIQDVKLPLKILKPEQVGFCDDKLDTFSQTEEIKAEQPIGQALPSPHQLPSQQLEVTELAKFIFLVTQASISIWLNCQQWVTRTVFPSMIVTIPHMIVQPLTTNSIAAEFPIETAIVMSPMLSPNQLIPVAKHALEYAEISTDCQVATAAGDQGLTDHKLAALDKSLPGHTIQQKLDFALNKMAAKTYVNAAQKTQALQMLGQNHDVFSFPCDKPTFTNELTISIDTGTAKLGLLSQDSNCQFNVDHKNAFKGIKKALTSSPFLCYPVYNGKAQFVIQTDTSMTAIEAILYQENGDNQWVIAYNSCVLTDT